jgi:hypothetical protein
MLRHDHITDDHEAIAVPHLFKNAKKEIALRPSLQERESAITTIR